jgi:hypothetical protein
MDKIWYAERIKECKSVKPEIVRLLKEEFKISDKDFDCIMYDLESKYHSTPDTLLRMAILNKCAKRGYDYEECEHYLDLIRSSGVEKLFNQYMTCDTLYGDWSCTTFNSDTKEPIGRFCADAGLVSVISLDEVLKYNPDYDCDLKESFTATIIRDFYGTVQFVIRQDESKEEYYLEVIGHGINKVTDEPINFIGKQTGF